MGMIFLQCNEIKFREFPNLLFGKSNGETYFFDATAYIEKSGCQDKTVDDFKAAFRYFIDAVCDVYSLTYEQIFITSHHEHILIDETLALAFIAYIDSEFAIYMLERVADMLIDGVVLSDTYLLSNAGNRFSRDQLLQLITKE